MISKKILLFLVPLLMFNLASAFTLTLENPMNLTYTSSLGIPLELTATGNNGTCWFTLNAGTNVEIPDCQDNEFNVDYDGAYLLQAFAQNSSSTQNANITFTVDRTSEFQEGKPLLAGIIILVLFGIAVLFFIITKSLSNEKPPAFTMIAGFVSLISMATAIYMTFAAINEYLKFPALSSMFEVYLYALMMITILAMIYGFVLLMVYTLNYFRTLRKKI